MSNFDIPGSMVVS